MTIKQCLKLTLTSALSLALGIVLLSIVFRGWDNVPFFPKEASNSHLKSIVSQLSYCESRNNPNAYVHNDGGSPSAGILQFKIATFYGQWKRLVNPDIELADASNLWRDASSQRYLAERMLQENWEARRNWYTCSKKIGIL